MLIITGSLVVAAFLLGFIPQYRKSRDLESQLNSTRHELASESVKLQGDELDLLIGYVYLETNQKNYGLASEASTKFFNRVRTHGWTTFGSQSAEIPSSGLVQARRRHWRTGEGRCRHIGKRTRALPKRVGIDADGLEMMPVITSSGS